MKITAIKTGKWYETNAGLGLCVRVGGCHPPAVKIDIRLPFPRGICNVSPRDVLREIPAPEKEV